MEFARTVHFPREVEFNMRMRIFPVACLSFSLLALLIVTNTARAQQGPADCIGGSAAGFACSNINLLAQVNLNQFSTTPTSVNDIWGFVDLNTGLEYAIIGLQNGVAVIDISDATSPIEVGTIGGQSSSWRDIKIYQFFDAIADRWQAYAYVSTEAASDRLTVVALTGLPNSVGLSGRVTPETEAHNVYIANVDLATGLGQDGSSPTLITAGSNLSGGAFRAYGLGNPINPAFILSAPGGGYMHDASSSRINDARMNTQCINAVTTCDLLYDFNETTFVIWDISNPNDPRQLSSTTYANVGYTHSGWPTEDSRYLLVNDETDELNVGLNTTIRIFDLSVLDLAPDLPVVEVWTGPTAAIDHNGFVRGNRYYLSNYTRGLTILDISDPTNIPQSAVGHFDTFTSSDARAFSGAWGVYPFLPSGNILVSDINGGLFVLEDDTLDTPQGQLSFSTAATGALEGGVATINVSRLGGSTGVVTVDYDTLSASADTADYTPASGTLMWSAGDSSEKSININLTADGDLEDPQGFFVRLFNPTSGATLASPAMASVFVSDVGVMPEVEFLDSQYMVSEDDGRVVAVVKRPGSAAGAVTVNYRTEAQSAAPGSDYVEVTNGQLSWNDQDATPRTVEISILLDITQEAVENFDIVLFNPAGATLGAVSQTTININDATAPPPPPPPPRRGGGGAMTVFGLLLFGFLAVLRRRQVQSLSVSRMALKRG